MRIPPPGKHGGFLRLNIMTRLRMNLRKQKSAIAIHPVNGPHGDVMRLGRLSLFFLSV